MSPQAGPIVALPISPSAPGGQSSGLPAPTSGGGVQAAADPPVNSIGDAPAKDATKGPQTANMIKLDDGTMVPEITLRSAIQAANNGKLASITFAIPKNVQQNGVWTITPATPLDPVAKPISIDGSTQPGYMNDMPVIVLSGSKLNMNVKADGLDLTGGKITVNGLIINSFTKNGIDIHKNGADTVTNCYIGTDPAGAKALPNALDGILINDVAMNSIGAGGSRPST